MPTKRLVWPGSQILQIIRAVGALCSCCSWPLSAGAEPSAYSAKGQSCALKRAVEQCPRATHRRSKQYIQSTAQLFSHQGQDKHSEARCLSSHGSVSDMAGGDTGGRSQFQHSARILTQARADVPRFHSLLSQPQLPASSRWIPGNGGVAKKELRDKMVVPSPALHALVRGHAC